MAAGPLADWPAEAGAALAATVPMPAYDPAPARAAADALDAVAAVVQRHLEAWPVEMARVESWTGAHRERFDLDAETYLADAGPAPEALRDLARALRGWADELLTA